MPSEIEALRQEIAALRQEIRPRQPRQRTTPQTCLRLRLDREDYAMMQAEAAARSITVAELTRQALATLLPRALRQPKEIPVAFRARKKLQHFDDGKADTREMLSAAERSAKAHEAIRLGHAAHQAMVEAGLAPATAARDRAVAKHGMMTDAPLQSVPKLSRTG